MKLIMRSPVKTVGREPGASRIDKFCIGFPLILVRFEPVLRPRDATKEKSRSSVTP